MTWRWTDSRSTVGEMFGCVCAWDRGGAYRGGNASSDAILARCEEWDAGFTSLRLEHGLLKGSEFERMPFSVVEHFV